MNVLKAPQDKVLAVLQSVAGIVERRHTLPILANVMLKKSGNALQFTTSDLEIQIRTTAELGGDSADFATTVNARKLIDILRSMPGDQTVGVESSQDKLVLKGGKSRFSPVQFMQRGAHVGGADALGSAQRAAQLAVTAQILCLGNRQGGQPHAQQGGRAPGKGKGSGPAHLGGVLCLNLAQLAQQPAHIDFRTGQHGHRVAAQWAHTDHGAAHLRRHQPQ